MNRCSVENIYLSAMPATVHLLRTTDEIVNVRQPLIDHPSYTQIKSGLYQMAERPTAKTVKDIIRRLEDELTIGLGEILQMDSLI